ncbi:MAG: VapC toxin family PIN domain ribonuclease [Thermodesulfovibrio sp.]|nr:VapC toxin family PIN domain ribonuclease [Thermodesulfovibrio sp.]
MNKVFMDTSAIVAIFDRGDEHHSEALKTLEEIKRNRIKLLISDYIFDESITTALSNAGYDVAVKVGEFILNSRVIEFIWLNETVKMKAWDYFKRHSDKGYSFTDCTSFVFMKDLKIDQFFAFDKDFSKAGFIDFSKRYRKN